MALRNSIFILTLFFCAVWSICRADFELDSTDIIFHFHGPDTLSLIGEIITPLGDINQDGYDDVAISSWTPFGVFVFWGGNPSDAEPDMFYDGYRGAAPPIDLTGDGVNEFIAYTEIEYGSTFTGAIYFFEGYADSIATIPYDSLKPDTDIGGFPYLIRTAYVDSDNYGDLLAVKYHATAGAVILYYSGAPIIDKEPDWSYIIVYKNHTCAGFDFIDFNGDNYLDVCVGMQARDRRDTASYIYIFTGPDFGAEPDIIIEEPSFISQVDGNQRFPKDVVNVGDYNGDGWDDLGVSYVASGVLTMVYNGGPTSDTLYDYRLGGDALAISGAGDINNDGYDDIACGGAGSWAGTIYLYSGGPGTDTIPDEEVISDDLPPVFLDDIGYRVSTAGDFNNDGYDDVMFSCRNFSIHNPWDVFIVGGSSDIPTAVWEGGSSLEDFRISLRQNYPNPFNPSTIFEYTIPKSGHVKITIYDILGRQIATLTDEWKQAGIHKASWNGHDDSGHMMPSGIYFYCLETDGVSEARKMILLK